MKLFYKMVLYGIIGLVLFFGRIDKVVFAQRYPFPQDITYQYGIKPNNVSQDVMDDTVKDIYNTWKSNYLLDAGLDAEGHQMYRINCHESEDGDTVSEGQGYGMLVEVIIAGYDTNAQNYYNGLFYFYKKYRNANGLMKWYVNASGNPSKGNDNATDGDLDAALSLIMADAQWGSEGEINYSEEAIKVLNSLISNNVDMPGNDGKSVEDNDWSIRCGDWWGYDSTNLTRTSDFLVSHFKIFAQFYDSRWTNVANRCYNIINIVQSNYSSSGLLPDFLYTTNGNPDVMIPPGKIIESVHDGEYHYNACRDPWRITIDYLLSGDLRAKNSMVKISDFIKSKTSANPDNIVDGYHLNGNAYGGGFSLAFAAPFGVAAMVDSTYQDWLNDLYNKCISAGKEGYYEDTINLLSLFVMTGNWWAPSFVTPTTNHQENVSIRLSENKIKAYPSIFSKGEEVTIVYKVANELLPLIEGKDIKMIVYNLYGEKIYEKEVTEVYGKIITTWDGTVNNKYVSPGLYIIKLRNDYFEKIVRVIYR